jgi:Toprim domain
MTVEEVVEHLGGGRPDGQGGFMARCALAEHHAHGDRTPSLHVSPGDDDNVLLKCFAGCPTEEIVRAVGLQMRDLYYGNGTDREPDVVYPYHDEHGVVIYEVGRWNFGNGRKTFKAGLHDPVTGQWVGGVNGIPRVLFQLPRVLKAKEDGNRIYICEGEKDALVLQKHLDADESGAVATTAPFGAGNNWPTSFTDTLVGATEIVIVVDNDEKGLERGEQVYKSLDGKVKSLRAVRALSGNDAHDHLVTHGLGLDDFVDITPKPEPPPDRPDNRTDARKAASLSEKSVRSGDRTITGLAAELAQQPNILRRFRADVRQAGLAGGARLAGLVFLAVSGRMLALEEDGWLVSLAAKGASSAGKSYEMKAALRFFPDDAYLNFGSMTKGHILTTPESFEHRYIYVPEWASIAQYDDVVVALRLLLSEQEVSHGTSEEEAGKRQSLLLQKKGPIGLLVTTTWASIDEEMETRLLSVPADDSPELTKQVMRMAAKKRRGKVSSPVDFAPWHELHEWNVAHGETGVDVPFADPLADMIPPIAVRLRRDFGTLLTLIQNCALLHRATRQQDDDGRIVATVNDYAIVRALVGPVLSGGVQASVSKEIRETVETVATVIRENGTVEARGVDVLDRLPVGRSEGYVRINAAEAAGYLVNLAERRRPKKLVLGRPVPDADSEPEFLPSPESVVRWQSGEGDRTDSSLNHAPGSDLSGSPVSPVEPPKERENQPERLTEVAATNGHPEPPFCDECNSSLCRHVAPEVWGQS